jgi:hypothetical protein
VLSKVPTSDPIDYYVRKYSVKAMKPLSIWTLNNYSHSCAIKSAVSAIRMYCMFIFTTSDNIVARMVIIPLTYHLSSICLSWWTFFLGIRWLEGEEREKTLSRRGYDMQLEILHTW